eukprot:gene16008-19046_t
MSAPSTPSGSGGPTSYQTYGLKIGFPPGFSMKYKNIRLPDYNVLVRDAIHYIAAKQTIPKPEQYVLQISFLVPDHQMTSPMGMAQPSPRQSTAVSPGGARFERKIKWMDDNAKLSSYPLNAPEVIVELKKRYQCVKVVERSVSQLLVADVTRPVADLMGFVLCKFKLDPAGDYRLFHSNAELPLDGDIRSLNIDTSVPFFVRDKTDARAFETLDDPSLYEDEGSDEESSHNLSLEVPAKTLTNVLKEGFLKKQNRKKSWNPRYFILTDKLLYYYKTPNDRKASGIINYKEHIIRVVGSTKDAKLELYPKETHIAATSASTHTHPGSFVIKFDSESEMLSWNNIAGGFNFDVTPTNTPPVGKSKMGRALFGVPVERSIHPGSEVPLIITQTIDYIEKKAMDVVGIFRLSGSVLTIENWKKTYDKGERCDLFQEVDPHAIAGLLKLYLRELPEPLLTYDRYDKFIAAQSMEDQASRIKLIKHLVRSLPQVNQAILSKLMAFLGRVAQHAANNKMQIHNLSTVFGPNLIREKQLSASSTNVQSLVEDTPIINALTLSLIRDYQYIFGDKELPEQKVLAKTLYEYNGSEEGPQTDDLLFAQGVTIRVTQQARDGWWLGEYQGKTGRFPATYVELLPQSPASLLRTKSNSNLSKKKKFMLEMESARNKTVENEKLLAQMRERKVKLEATMLQLAKEKEALLAQKDVQNMVQLINQTKSKHQAIANIPKQIDTLLVKYGDYKKSHEELATVRQVLCDEFDSFVNNPKVRTKIESREKEAMQAKLDILSSKLEDATRTRQKSLSSKLFQGLAMLVVNHPSDLLVV